MTKTPVERPTSVARRLQEQLHAQAARLEALERERRARQPQPPPEMIQQHSTTLRTLEGPHDPARQTARPDPSKREVMWQLRDGSDYMTTGSSQHPQTSVPLDQPPRERYRL